MGKIFDDDTGVLFQNTLLMNDCYLYECGYEECKSTKSYEFIPIDYWVIHYCIAGEGYFQLLDEQNHIKAGDIFMIPPHTRNKYYPHPKRPWSYRWVGLRGSKVKNILAPCGLSHENYIIHHHVDSKLEHLFERIYLNLQNKQEFMAFGSVFYLLSYLRNNIRNAQLDHLSSGESHFYKVLNYMHKNYAKDISISDIAEYNNIDRTYVFKLFQKYTGISPSKYLQHYRLDKACILLRKSSFSITAISYTVGFHHVSYFTKLFKEYIGINPSRYRKKFMK